MRRTLRFLFRSVVVSLFMTWCCAGIALCETEDQLPTPPKVSENISRQIFEAKPKVEAPKATLNARRKPLMRDITKDLMQSKQRPQQRAPWLFPNDDITVHPLPPMPIIVGSATKSKTPANKSTPAVTPESPGTAATDGEVPRPSDVTHADDSTAVSEENTQVRPNRTKEVRLKLFQSFDESPASIESITDNESSIEGTRKSNVAELEVQSTKQTENRSIDLDTKSVAEAPAEPTSANEVESLASDDEAVTAIAPDSNEQIEDAQSVELDGTDSAEPKSNQADWLEITRLLLELDEEAPVEESQQQVAASSEAPSPLNAGDGEIEQIEVEQPEDSQAEVRQEEIEETVVAQIVDSHEESTDLSTAPTGDSELKASDTQTEFDSLDSVFNSESTAYETATDAVTIEPDFEIDLDDEIAAQGEVATEPTLAQTEIASEQDQTLGDWVIESEETASENDTESLELVADLDDVSNMEDEPELTKLDSVADEVEQEPEQEPMIPAAESTASTEQQERQNLIEADLNWTQEDAAQEFDAAEALAPDSNELQPWVPRKFTERRSRKAKSTTATSFSGDLESDSDDGKLKPKKLTWAYLKSKLPARLRELIPSIPMWVFFAPMVLLLAWLFWPWAAEEEDDGVEEAKRLMEERAERDRLKEARADEARARAKAAREKAKKEKQLAEQLQMQKMAAEQVAVEQERQQTSGNVDASTLTPTAETSATIETSAPTSMSPEAEHCPASNAVAPKQPSISTGRDSAGREIADAVATAMSKELVATETTDDFTKLDGIDGIVQQALYDAGYQTYVDLQKADPAHLQYIVSSFGDASANANEWPRQAAFASRGDWAGLEEYQRIAGSATH